MKIMIAAAGTGGHVFPGLAVAAQLMAEGHHVEWLGTDQPQVLRWVESYAIPIHKVPLSGVRGKGFKRWLFLPFQLIKSVLYVFKVMRQLRPDVVLVMGGYVSVPAGLAARLLRIPLCVHEQNSIVGLSNRILAPFSQLLLAGLPLNQVPMAWESARWVGNPLRAMLKREMKTQASLPFRVLIIGGSQGAQFLNELMPEVMKDWSARQDFQIWHQTGRDMKTQVEAAYQHLAMEARVSDFIEDMGEAYAWADLVIARAGALTVTELMQVARPALFIPFPFAVDDHQFANATLVAQRGGAEVLRQEVASVGLIRERLTDYLCNPQLIAGRYQILNEYAENNSAAHIATLLIDLAIKNNKDKEAPK